MNEVETFILVIVAIIVLFFVTRSDSEYNLEGEEDDSEYYKDRYMDKEEKEMFYHPTTGYCGTREEMDAYIINREKKLKNE